MTKKFDFDSGEYGPERVEIPVKYKGHQYVLCEATEDIIAKYRAKSRLGHAKIRKGSETVSMEQEYADCYLLSQCLFAIGDESDTPKRTPVKEAELRQWPRRVTSPLIDCISDIANSYIPETAEEVESRIARDTEKLERMRRKGQEEEEDPAKN